MLSRVDSLGEIEREIKSVQPVVSRVSVEDERNILRSWLLNKSDNLVDDDAKSLAASMGFNLGQDTLPIQRNVTNTTIAPLRNLGTIGAIEDVLKNYNGVRQVCDVISKQKGSQHNIPVINDIANLAAEMAAENTAVANVTLTVSNVAINVRTHSSGIFPLSVEAIQDSEFSLVDVVKDNLATRLARRLNLSASTNATFVGLTTAVPLTTLTWTAATPTYANLLNMFSLLDMGHQNNASWMFSTTQYIRMLSILDANGLPLWNPTTALNGMPSTLFGKSFTVNDDLPANTIMYGDMKKYKVIEVGAPELVIAKERYRFDNNAIGIMISHRFGGGYAGNGICRFVGA